jgi:hypothetical protein
LLVENCDRGDRDNDKVAVVVVPDVAAAVVVAAATVVVGETVLVVALVIEGVGALLPLAPVLILRGFLLQMS